MGGASHCTDARSARARARNHVRAGDDAMARPLLAVFHLVPREPHERGRIHMPIGITGGAAPSSCAPNVTSANDKLSAGTAVTVTGGTFTAALAPMSVTSFVCK